MKKTIVMALAIALVLCMTVGGTLAWLIDSTDPVENTFTYGDINITLDESDDLDLKMVPGKKITKDPVVTVLANSEDCWLFVKVEEHNNFEDFMTYTIAAGWTPLDGVAGVYYRQVSTSTDPQEFAVILNNTVTVSADVEKTDLAGITDETKPTLTFTAYAIQTLGFENKPAEAWAEINK